jgi:hypothetical protein
MPVKVLFRNLLERQKIIDTGGVNLVPLPLPRLATKGWARNVSLPKRRSKRSVGWTFWSTTPWKPNA